MKYKAIVTAVGCLSALAATVAAVLLGAFGTPVVSVCDQVCQARTELKQRAAAGDTAATKALFARSKEQGLNTEAERYSMEGAFAGDPQLQAEYFQRWLQLDQSERAALLHAFERSYKGPVADCYASKLRSLSLDNPCPVQQR